MKSCFGVTSPDVREDPAWTRRPCTAYWLLSEQTCPPLPGKHRQCCKLTHLPSGAMFSCLTQPCWMHQGLPHSSDDLRLPIPQATILGKHTAPSFSENAAPRLGPKHLWPLVLGPKAAIPMERLHGFETDSPSRFQFHHKTTPHTQRGTRVLGAENHVLATGLRLF